VGADTDREVAGETGGRARPSGRPRDGHPRFWVAALAVGSGLAVLVANLGGIATGDDGVGYRAIADSLLDGRGLRYFLEDPLTVWPPLWPALMAAIARVTPLDTLGAAVLLNTVMAAAAVVVAHRLLQRVVRNDRLVLLGTAVVAFGSSTIGFGHLLMTDFAFAVVVMLWMLALMDWRATGRWAWIAAAAGWVWIGFGLRYVAIVLIPTGALWLLFGGDRTPGRRIRDAVSFAGPAAVVPVAWMLRNHALDGTWTGPRYPSARGPLENAFDIAATLGRFLLPGVLNGATRAWAVVGLVVGAVAVVLAHRVLTARVAARGPIPRQLVDLLGRPAGLLLLQAGLYLLYMLWIRSTTALNQLDLRLLNPAYLPLVVLGLALVARLRELPPEGGRPEFRAAWAATHAWAVLNVAAGAVAVVVFALGHPFFSGNYESDTYVAIRANPALDAVPTNCETFSNQPNGLYPRLEAGWSPRRTGLESDEPVDDLERLRDRLRDRPGDPVCLVWVDEDPRWGHLWPLDELADRLALTEVAADDGVTVYRVGARP
jgi:hypothetical protein